jgi:hypothetical protein
VTTPVDVLTQAEAAWREADAAYRAALAAYAAAKAAREAAWERLEEADAQAHGDVDVREEAAVE